MMLDLDPSEAALLLGLLEAANRERRNSPESGSIRDRATRALDRGRLEALRAKLSRHTSRESHREALIDHSIEETFPASDPPARSSAREPDVEGR